jgi:hypothetical protein
MDMTDERFVNWMRTSGEPRFTKLWGRIEQDLDAGLYYVEVSNNYDVTIFNGDKGLRISTISSLGADNWRLAYAYIGVGLSCTVLGAIAMFFSVIRK